MNHQGSGLMHNALTPPRSEAPRRDLIDNPVTLARIAADAGEGHCKTKDA